LNENKKGGAGKHNWGKAEDELAGTADSVAEGATVEPNSEEKPADENANPAAENADAAATTEGVDEPKVVTLEEYEKSLREKAVKLELPQLRSAGEGEDNQQWQKFEKLDREGDQLLSFGVPNKKKKAAAKKEKSKSTVSVDQVFRVEKPEGERGGRGRGGRGGRGGDRSRGDERPRRDDEDHRHEGGDRSDRSNRGDRGDRGNRRGSREGGQKNRRDVNIELKDDSAFPALGGK